jgi:hypothetical protein
VAWSVTVVTARWLIDVWSALPTDVAPPEVIAVLPAPVDEAEPTAALLWLPPVCAIAVWVLLAATDCAECSTTAGLVVGPVGAGVLTGAEAGATVSDGGAAVVAGAAGADAGADAGGEVAGGDVGAAGASSSDADSG